MHIKKSICIDKSTCNLKADDQCNFHNIILELTIVNNISQHACLYIFMTGITWKSRSTTRICVYMYMLIYIIYRYGQWWQRSRSWNTTHCSGCNTLRWWQHAAVVQHTTVVATHYGGGNALRWWQQTAVVATRCSGGNTLQWWQHAIFNRNSPCLYIRLDDNIHIDDIIYQPHVNKSTKQHPP